MLYLYVVIIDSDTFPQNTELKSVTKYAKCIVPIIQGDQKFCAPDDYNTIVRCTKTF